MKVVLSAEAEPFWNSCKTLNSAPLGGAEWRTAFNALVGIAAQLTAPGSAARRFLNNQYGLTITVEESPELPTEPVKVERKPLRQLRGRTVAAVANDQ